ncbi:hypothetical protein ACH5RR_009733 [Cinchona calisaya]|uniref:RING-type E3 ubiquitin transferase n=1 Tax=Cinchona calisaya TaxID=153742 RepID=A0ABD3AH73_9GENT
MQIRPVHSFNNASPQDPPEYQHWMMLQQRYMQENHPPDDIESAWDDEDHPENYSPATRFEDQQRENTLESWDDDDDDDQRENHAPQPQDQNVFQSGGRLRSSNALQESVEPLSVLFLIISLDDVLDEEFDNVRHTSFLEALQGLMGQDGVLDEEFDNVRHTSFLEALQGLMGQDGNPLEETIISKHLKTRKYQKLANQDDGDEDDDEICVVCQSEFENEETLGILGCGHQYHVDCIKRWLQHKNVCPICKRTAIQEEI